MKQQQQQQQHFFLIIIDKQFVILLNFLILKFLNSYIYQVLENELNFVCIIYYKDVYNNIFYSGWIFYISYYFTTFIGRARYNNLCLDYTVQIVVKK